MHEEVLSAGTLEKGKKKKNSTKYDSSESISKNANILLRAFRAPLCHRDLRAPISVRPTAHRYDSSPFCYSINPLFVLNLTYPHSCSYPHLPLWWEGGDARGERAWPFTCSHAWLKQMVRVDPSAQPEKMLCLYPWLVGEREPARIGRFSVSLIEVRTSLSHRCHRSETCVLLNMKQVFLRPNDWCKERKKKNQRGRQWFLPTRCHCLPMFLRLRPLIKAFFRRLVLMQKIEICSVGQTFYPHLFQAVYLTSPFPFSLPRLSRCLRVNNTLMCLLDIPPTPPMVSNVHRRDLVRNEACIFISYLLMQQQCYIKVTAVMVYIKCIQNTLMITSKVSSGLEIA